MKLPKTKEYDVPIQELDNKILLSDLDEPDRYYKDGVFRYLLLNKLQVISYCHKSKEWLSERED